MISKISASTKPEEKLEAVKIPPLMAVKLEGYLKQNPTEQILLAGLRAGASANAGFSLGVPLTLRPNLKLHPYSTIPTDSGLISDAVRASGAKTASSANATQLAHGWDALRVPVEQLAKSHAGRVTASGALAVSVKIPSSVTKATQVASLLDAFRGPVEQLAKTHPRLDTPLDFLGVVVATPQMWNALTSPGSKNKGEVFFAVGQAAVCLAKVVSDLVPGLQHAKPALMWTGVIMKTGEQVYAVIHKPEATRTVAKRVKRKDSS